MIFASTGKRGLKLLLGPDGYFSGASRRPRAGRRAASCRPSRDSYGICGQLINVEPGRSRGLGDLTHDARSIVARAPYSSFPHLPDGSA